MKKKLTALSLALLLSLSLLTVGQGARANEPEPDPDPIPVVTIQPGDPEKPEEPPAESMGGSNDCLPKPGPIDQGFSD